MTGDIMKPLLLSLPDELADWRGTAAELAEAIGIEHQLGQWPTKHAARPYQSLREVLTRMARAGQIRVESTDDQPRYWPRKGRGSS